MNKFMKSSIYKRIAFLLVILALIFHFIGLIAPFWVSIPNGKKKINIGLWLNCSGLDCSPFSASPGWLITAGVFDVLSFTVGVVCLICLVIFIFVPQSIHKKRKWPLLVAACLAFTKVLLQQIAIGIFLDNVYKGELIKDAFSHLSWAVAFSIVSTCVFAAVCILLFIDLIRIYYDILK